jgi:uncharacterized protein
LGSIEPSRFSAVAARLAVLKASGERPGRSIFRQPYLAALRPGAYMARDSGKTAQPDVLQPDAARSLDIFEFARHQRSAVGSVSLACLPRLLAEVPPDAAQLPAALDWQARGSVKPQAGEAAQHDERWLDLSVDGAVWLECQRCLAPHLQVLEVKVRYRIVETEAEADAAPLDDDEADVIVGSRQFDLVDLIEEEVLLSLPLVPKHAVCPAVHDSLLTGVDGGESPSDGDQADEVPQVQEKTNPFAALAALKRGSSGAGGKS